MIARSLLLWLCILPLAIANGAFREAVLVPRMKPSPALLTSGLTLIAVVFAFTLLTVRWIPRPAKSIGYFTVGGLWLACTVAFEFLFGHFVAGDSWSELCTSYTFRGGNIWPLVLLCIFALPYFAARLRRLDVHPA